MILFLARKKGTELYIDQNSIFLKNIAGAAKLNSKKVIENKIKSYLEYNKSSEIFEIVEFLMIEKIGE